MSARKYEMTRRAAAVEQTRARIVAATVAAHHELGIQATSWDEIARRARVGVGTVYRHFPTLDELLLACGEVVERTLALPAAHDARDLFADTADTHARIKQLVAVVFGVYQRGAPFIDNIRRERRHLPQLEDFHSQIEQALDVLAREALRPLRPSRRVSQVVRALIDLSTWRAFTERGIPTEQATETISQLIECALCSPISSVPVPQPGEQHPGPQHEHG